MLNLNKVFPRLPIRLKLGIAFAALATLPLIVTGLIGARVTLRYIGASAVEALEHDLVRTRERTEHLLTAVQEDLAYLGQGILAEFVLGRTDREAAARHVDRFLEIKASFIRVKLFDLEGDPLLIRVQGRGGFAAEALPLGSGLYYVYRARTQPDPARPILVPVELRGPASSGEEVRPVAAVAAIQSLMDESGRMVAVVVGEFYAARLFAALGDEPARYGGITGVVGADGRYLYHSRFKNDWNKLLLNSEELNLADEFDNDAALRITSGAPDRLRTADGRLVSVAPLRLLTPGSDASLFLYHSVPIASIEGPARRFRIGVGTGGLVVLASALVLALIGATQFTRPIYALREATRRIAAGDFRYDLRIETNDELEELAADFDVMGSRLKDYTQELEHLVAKRTAELQRAHSEIEEILSHSEDAILRLELDGTIRIWNRGAAKLFGYTAQEAVGRDLDELLLPEGEVWRQDAAEIRQRLFRAGSIVDMHTRRRRADGSIVEVSLSQTMILGEAEEPIGWALIVRDISRQRELERQILRSEQLAAAGQLAAGVAHEINNPIGIILNRLECMELELADHWQASMSEDLTVIRAQTERVGDVARRLLGIAKDATDERREIELNDLIERVTVFLRPTLEKRKIRFESRLDPEIPEIQASQQGLEIVLLNLLLNAADACAEDDQISITTRWDPNRRLVQLTVADTGHGIPDDIVEQIFEPFFTTKRYPRGTGLGLAVTRNIVQAHGGTISVSTEPGSGTRFVVTLGLGGKS